LSSIVNFTLENLNVPVGAAVTWTNQDGAPHTSTSGIPDAPSHVWESPVLSSGSSFSFTFTEVGAYSYFCRIHPTVMQATISVGQIGTPVPSAPRESGSYDY
jgi:plastocyanin